MYRITHVKTQLLFRVSAHLMEQVNHQDSLKTKRRKHLAFRDVENFLLNQNEEERSKTARVGFHHAFSPEGVVNTVSTQTYTMHTNFNKG